MNRVKSFWLMMVVLTLMLTTVSGAAVGQGNSTPKQVIDPQTGKARLLTFEVGTLGMPARDVRTAALAASDGAIARYAAVFGAATGSEYTVMAEPFTLNSAPGTATAVRYRQTLGGLPVYGAQLIVNVRGDGAATLMTGKVTSADVSILNLAPSLSAAVAGQSALTYVATRYGVPDASLSISDAGLWVYDPAIIKPGVSSAERAGVVWQAVISSNVGQPIRVVALIDATTGDVRFSFNKLHASMEYGDWQSARNAGVNFGAGLVGPATANSLSLPNGVRVTGTADLATYDANNGTTLPGTFLCDESDLTCTDGADMDADSAHTHANGTYNFYWNTHQRDSLNNAGLQLRSSVHIQVGYCNAFWNNTQMAYGDGCPGGSIVTDDVVAHELTHGVTSNTSDLIYAYDSGAINESFSDVWGEYYDLSNGTVEDTPANRWVIGEEFTGGSGFRDMQNPTLKSDPDRVGSSFFWTDARDTGGVHINSGINNKAAYLMADGDTFNGQTITGIGLVKPLHIYYYAQTMLLSEASTYNDLAVYLSTACDALVGGAAGITTGDCDQVDKAVLATEMALPSPHLPDSAEVCSTGFTPSDLFYDDFENATTSGTKWTTSALGGANAWTISSATNPLIGARTMRADNIGTASNGTVSSSVSTLTTAINGLPANAYVHFEQQYVWEYDGWDGGIVQYTTNNGVSWTAFSNAQMEGELYPGLATGDSSIPFAGLFAYTGDSFGEGSTRISLAALAGMNVKIRFHAASDESFSAGNPDGWWIDNFRVYTCIPVVAGSVTVAPTTADMTEGGTTDTYTVVLDSVPASNVNIAVAGDADCSVSPTTLTFTPANSNAPQTVTVTAVNDTDIEGAHTCTITHSATSGDAAYNGIGIASMNGNVTDDDSVATGEELLSNGGFETAGATTSVPFNWTVQAPTGDKRACPVALGNIHGGACAFKFTGSATDASKLTQVVDLTGITFNTGDTLSASAFFKGNNATAKIKVTLFVYYTGNPTPVKTSLNVLQNPAYTQRSLADYALTSGAVSQIKLVFNHQSSAGMLWVDDASLYQTYAVPRSAEVMGLPAPEGFRK